MDEKPPKTLLYPTQSALTKHNFFRRSKLKKSVTTHFSPCIDEKIKKNRNKIGAKMKTLEAKPFDQNAEIDCLHRPCSRPAPRGKIESVRTHSEVTERFDSFSLLKLLFLVRNWYCWSRRAFPRQMTLQSREKKLQKRQFLDTADRHEKLYGRSRLYARVQGRHGHWRCSFAFFESFL